ncbi:hypothetical protein TrST_g13474 [Triparma strigata]|uniref:Uncharacterized protein n=1 Tax=Triparma strigata TaxID=1606541 RepID=A0A9W7C9A0_9STRA|nr:hypothetical protein TrST_g13474 [Triparma strigata]
MRITSGFAPALAACVRWSTGRSLEKLMRLYGGEGGNTEEERLTAEADTAAEIARLDAARIAAEEAAAAETAVETTRAAEAARVAREADSGGFACETDSECDSECFAWSDWISFRSRSTSAVNFLVVSS